MKKSGRRSLAGAAAALGVAGLGFAVMRQRRARQSATALAGKVVLITGGSRGLGFALAREFASRGARLALTSRHQDELDRAAGRLVDECGIAEENILAAASDVGNFEEVERLVAAATGHFGAVDIVVNNAGVIMVGPVESHPLAHYENAMRINFFGAVHSTLAVLPQMMERGGGTIVNIASVGGKVAFPHLLPYVASKYALVGWSQGLRTELAPKGIRVTTICPGVMRTGSHIQAQFSGDAAREYKWFAAAATSPATAVDAGAAARGILNAILRNSAESSIGLQALAAARLSNLFPEVTAEFLSLVNHFLPKAGSARSDGEFADDSVRGERFRNTLPRLLERFGEEAIQRYNQVPEAAKV